MYSYQKHRQIEDSNVDRLEKWINSHDIAGITAWRDFLKDVHNEEATLLDKPLDGTAEERKYTKVENRARNRALGAALRSKGYGITKVQGFYPEGRGKTKHEESFIVVNLPNDPNFKATLQTLSEWYNQDTFVYKPKGAPKAVLVGTNDDPYVGYGNEKEAGGFVRDVKTDFMSRLRNGGFSFTNDTPEELVKESWADRKKARKVADSHVKMYCVDYSISSFYGGMAILSTVLSLQEQKQLPKF